MSDRPDGVQAVLAATAEVRTELAEVRAMGEQVSAVVRQIRGRAMTAPARARGMAAPLRHASRAVAEPQATPDCLRTSRSERAALQ